MHWLYIAAACVLLSAPASAKSAAALSHAGQPPQMLTSDPPPGTLGLGEIAFVDDGSCPAGQIKKVTGGHKTKGIARTTECVAR